MTSALKKSLFVFVLSLASSYAAFGLDYTNTKIHVKCNGDNTGSIKIRLVVPGTTPYTYQLWSDKPFFQGGVGVLLQQVTQSEDTAMFSNLGANSKYFIYVFDDDGTSNGYANQGITEPTLLTLSGVVSNIICTGQNNGAVNLTVSGGTTAYAYSWNTGSIAEDLAGRSQGTYNVTVTDGNVCTKTASYSLTEPTVIGLSAVLTHLSCGGANTGAINTTPSGGSIPYSFAWNDAITTEDRILLPAATYNLTLTDQNACSKTGSYIITSPSALNPDSTIVHVNCFGGNTGSVNLAISGGTGPFAFSWSNGKTTQNISSLVISNYRVTVTDAAGCTKTLSNVVTQPTVLSVNLQVAKELACYSGSDAKLFANTSGGTSPYVYTWTVDGSPVVNNNDTLSGQPKATFGVVVRDFNNCGPVNDNMLYMDGWPDYHGPVSDIVVDNAVAAATCAGTSNGTVTITSSGGTGARKYSLDGISYQVSNVFNLLAAGPYSVYSRDDSMCVAQGADVIITSNPTPTFTPTLTHVTCNGGSDGAISIAMTVGTAPYVFSWNNSKTTQNVNTLTQGTYTLSVTDANLCTGTGSYLITEPAIAISVSSASSTPTLCINTALTPITHTTTIATGIGAAVGLPAGVSAAWAANVITISGTPSANGVFNYSIPLTSVCGALNATGTITVTANKTVTTASSTPSLCINTALTAITHTTTLATGIGAATGLPTGLSAAWAANTITISGTPSAAGTFNYSIPLTGGCGTVDATGTITVTANNTVGAASSTPTLCINTALTVITHTTTGATGIGAATGFPAGVSAIWAANTITISGTPSAAGTFNYSIPLTGGCGVANATGTITVTANKTVTAASSTPTLCISTALTAITHTTTLATGIGAAVGLPAGVSAAWAANTITISGTPSAAGTFNYSIPLTGGCGTVNATGTITVTANKTVGAASSTPTLCINAVLTNITHVATGATGIGAAVGLPAGVSAAWAANTITISGTPSAAGTFNYNIPLTGGCGVANATGTITVSAVNTVGAASSSPTLCRNFPLTAITHATIGATSIGAAAGLPAGVSAAWAANTITISGTPSVAGTFNYTIPLAGGCGSVNATGTITISPTNTITLTSAVATTNQTICIKNAIVNVTYTTTGATGATFANFPSNISKVWAANVVTISGTPDIVGISFYSDTIRLTGGCSTSPGVPVFIRARIRINDTTFIGPASSTPILCINTPLIAILHNTLRATGISVSSGLPAGVTAAYAANRITISGTPTVSGVFNYSITLTGACPGLKKATGTITVTAANTVSAPSSTPTLCINTALTPITHTTVGATGIGAALGLPTGVSAVWAANTITISGTPTASGTFNYSIPLSGGCSAINAIGTITVSAANTVTAASSTPTLCINTVLTNITHVATGATGIGAAVGLPAGVSAAWAANTITISGTPSAAGTFNYNIPLTGGCGVVNATGTITVTANNTVGAASSTPTICINTALTAITHATVGATGIGLVTGLPAGVSAAWAANTITISGTPSVSGIFNYSILLTGGCGTVNATGTITVTAANTVTAASSTPTLCINIALTAITHTTVGATAIGAATGLPAGVTAAWAANTITISGTPSASGTFSYSIPLIGGCGTVNATGTITVTPANTVTAASSTPTLCINTALTAITHITTGATAIGAATGLPAGVTAAWAANTITISGTPSVSGTFNYSIPLTGGCAAVSATGTITVSVNNTVGAPSSTPTVCLNTAIASVTHTTVGATGIGAAVGLPTGVTAAWAANLITISGTPSVSGTFIYSIPLTGGCSVVNATGTITVTDLSLSHTITHVNCNGGNTGIVDITPANGNPLYTFLWNSGATTEDVNAKTAGIYTVTVTDNIGCIISGSYTITQATPIVTSGSIIHTCTGISAGSIDLSIIGGNTPYTFSWSNASTTEDIVNISDATYSVTVTDQTGCNKTSSYVLTAHPAITIAAAVTPVDCNGFSTGDIDLTVSGGSPAFTYSWSNATTDVDLMDFPAATYTITITDSYNCTATASYSITEPTMLTLSGLVTPVTCSGGSDGAVDITVGGGTLPYIYSWSNGSIIEDLSSLTSGTYNLTITDASLCEITGSYAIALLPQATAFAGTDGVICYTGNYYISDASVTNAASFVWRTKGDGQFSDSTIIDPVYTPGAFEKSLQTAKIYLWAFNVAGCAVKDSNTITLAPELNAAIGSPAPFNISANTKIYVSFSTSGHNLPFDLKFYLVAPDGLTRVALRGSAKFPPTPGCGPYPTSEVDSLTFTNTKGLVDTLKMCTQKTGGNWKPLRGTYGATGDWTVLNGMNPAQGGWKIAVEDCFASGSTSGFLSKAYISFTDTTVAGDTTTVSYSSGTISEAIVQPTFGGCMETSYQVPMGLRTKCFGSCDVNVVVSVNGGTPPYTVFDWLEASIPDGNTATLCAGSHSVVVTDAMGCKDTATVNVSEPLPIVINTLTFTDSLACNGDTYAIITIAATGGTGSVVYSVDGGIGYQASGNFINQSGGVFSIKVKDDNGCTIDTSITIYQPAAMIISETHTDPTCATYNDGEIHITATGGNIPYRYSTNGGIYYSLNADTLTLVDGTYNIVVKDVKGCTTSGGSVVIAAPSAIVYDSASYNDTVLCYSDSSDITIYAHGGFGLLSYSVDAGASWQAASLFSRKDNGSYQLAIKDANACILQADTISIVDPDPIVIDSITTNIIGCNGDTSIIIILAHGGTGILNYSINNGATFSASSVFGGVLANTYQIAISDANACRKDTTIVITQPTAINVVVTTVNPTCASSTNGEVHMTASGGTAPYNYSLDGGVNYFTNKDTLNITYGIYAVVVRDSNLCTLSGGNVNIAAPGAIVYDSVVYTDTVPCAGDSTDIVIFAHGGSGALDYSIDAGATWQPDSLFAKQDNGTYHLAIRDTAGCILQTDTIIVVDPAGIVIDSVVYDSIRCNGLATNIHAYASGGSGTLNYTLLINGSIVLTNTTGVFDTIFADTIQISVKGNGPCTRDSILIITEPDAVNLNISKTDMSCHSVADGKIAANITGGSITYKLNLFKNAGAFDSILNINISDTVFKGLNEGNYRVDVIDTRLCSLSSMMYAIVNPDSVNILAVDSIRQCNGAFTIDFNVSGGVAPYSYSLDSGNIYLPGEPFSNILGGHYEMAVKDVNGCAAVNDYSFKIDLPILPIFIIDSIPINANPICSNDTTGAVIKFNDPSIALNYVMYNAIDTSLGVLPYPIRNRYYVTDSIVQTDSVFTGLRPGLYLARVDGPSCSIWDTFSVASYPKIIIDSIVTTNLANGNAGKIKIYAQGGVGTLSYAADTIVNPFNFRNNFIFDSLTAGLFYIVIKDAMGCHKDTSVVLTANSLPVAIIVSPDSLKCFGDSTSIRLIINSIGVSPFRTIIDSDTILHIANDTSIFGFRGGNHRIRVKDFTNQEYDSTINIYEPGRIGLDSAVIVPAKCIVIASGYNDSGSIKVYPNYTNAKLPYSFVWDRIGTTYTATTKNISKLIGGNYRLIIEDKDACRFDTTLFVNNYDTLKIVMTDNQHEICFGDKDTIKGGLNGPVSYYEWIRLSDHSRIINDAAADDQGGNFLVLLPSYSYYPNKTEEYRLFVHTNNHCLVDDTVKVVVYPKVDVIYMPDHIQLLSANERKITSQLITSFDAQYDALVNDAVVVDESNSPIYKWDAFNFDILTQKWSTTDANTTYFPSGNNNLSTPTFNGSQIKDSVMLRLTVSNSYGCVADDSLLVSLWDGFIPSGFTPNGDGINDKWQFDIGLDQYINVNVEVFNRWGVKVYENANYEDDEAARWDGNHNSKPCAVGTYYYVISVDDGKEKQTFSGPVSIIR